MFEIRRNIKYAAMVTAAVFTVAGIKYYPHSATSIMFNPNFYSTFFYSRDGVKAIFAVHAKLGMNRTDFENIVFAGGGRLAGTGSPEMTAGSPTSAHSNGTAALWAMYPMPIPHISNVGPARTVLAYFDKENRLVALFVDNELVFKENVKG